MNVVLHVKYAYLNVSTWQRRRHWTQPVLTSQKTHQGGCDCNVWSWAPGEVRHEDYLLVGGVTLHLESLKSVHYSDGTTHVGKTDGRQRWYQYIQTGRQLHSNLMFLQTVNSVQPFRNLKEVWLLIELCIERRMTTEFRILNLAAGDTWQSYIKVSNIFILPSTNFILFYFQSIFKLY